MNLPELGGGEFKVRLRARPSTSVTVTVSSADSLLTSVSPSSLTFTRDNWDDEQTVSIRTGEAPGTGDVNATVSLSAGGGNYNNVQSSVSITVDGNSQAGLTLSASSLQVREGGDATFTVRLAAQPRDAVLVELDRSDPNAVRLSTEALNFFVNTPPAGSNFGTRWDVAQTVTVTGLGDGDSDDETLTINLSARGLGSGYGGVSGVISVTVLDRDRDQFVTSTQSLQVQEGSSRIFTVRMQSQPSASRSISVQSADTGAVTAIPATLNFTTANWNQPQPVTVHGIQDSDAVNERVDVNLAVVGGGHTASVSVSVTDDDAPSLSISPTSLTLTEGERGSFSLSLDTQPTQSVSVALTQPSNTDVKILGSTELTFTTANWNRGQSVSVVTEEDVDIEDENVSIGFTASGGDYEGVTGSIAVTVTDDDRIEMIVSPGTLSLDEGESDDFTVRLQSAPNGDIQVIVYSSDDGAASASPATLDFTTSDWSTDKTVTVTAVDDGDVSAETATIHLLAVGAGTGTGSVAVNVADDDERGLTVSSRSVPVVEERTATFTVKLDSQPSSNVTVSVTSDSTQTATASPASLIFTASNWSQTQTVTVTGVADSNAENDSAKITLSASGGGYDGLSVEVAVTVADNDQKLLDLSVQRLDVNEGGSKTFTVRLTTLPTGNVSVAVAETSNADVTATPSSLTFTTTDWNSPQTVTVTAGEDSDGSDDTASVTLTASGADYAGVSGTVAVSVTDNDRGLTIVAASDPLTVDEGGNNTFTVRLAIRPTGSVRVAVAETSNADVSASPASLTFTTTDWNTVQTVTVTAIEDSDGSDDTASVTLSASGGGYAGVNDSVAVSVTDNDRGLTIVAASDPLSVNEGGSNTFTVRLTTRPTGNVRVAVAETSNADVTATPTPLTFTTTDWNATQTVTVTAAEDDDGSDDTASVTLTASGADYADVSDSVAVSVIDNDRGLTIVSASDPLSVDEGGNNTFTVRLKSRPTGSVRVAVAETSNADVTATPTSLTFTTTDWNSPQTVTVRAAEDDDGVDDTASVTLTASGGGYAGVSGAVAVSVADNDRGLTIVAASDPLTVDEGGSNTFTVRLKAQPSGSVSVAVAETGNADVSASPEELTFTTTDWNAPQTVTVTAGEDSDGSDDTASVTLTASGGGYAGVNDSVAVSVIDNDRGLTIVAESDPLSVDEGGNNTFTVQLTTQPSGSVSVAVAETSNADVTATPASLTFTTTDWNAAQTVTVTAGEDSDGIDDTASVTLTASGADYAGVSDSVSVSVIDNDRGLTIVSESDPLTVDEGGSNTFTVRLKSLPSGNVSVAVAETSNADVSAGPASLTFTTTDWNAAQTVTVTAIEDSDGIDDTASVTLTASNGGYAGVSDTVSVSVIDNDRGLTIVSESDPLSVDEGGNNTFTVRLKARPSGSVSVAVAETSNTDVTATPASLTFTTGNWNAPQTVTVTAGEDSDGSDDTASVTLTASGGGYAGVNDSMAVSVIDNDRGLTIAAESDPLTVDEGGSNTFTVQLKTQPSGSVSVAVAETSNADVTATPASLTFSTGNWNAPQIVTVNAPEDDDATSESTTITLTASGGDYGGLTGQVKIAVTDNDTAGLTLSTTSLAVGEGDTGAFTVRLATQPSGSVTVTTSSSAAAVATASPARLSFTAGNWETGQPVTVSATENDDPTDGRATISLSASGGGYGGLGGEVAVAVINNDPAVLLSNQRLSVFEGGEVEFTVRLATQPSAAVTVMTSTSSAAVATAAPASLSFTADNWNAAQTVTVTGGEDDNRTDDFTTISLAASGAPEYANISASLVTTVRENPDAELVLSAESLSVMEYGQASFGVKLSARPQGDVTVSLSLPTADSQVIRLSSDRLTFTADNWGGEQSVGVTGMPDPHDRANTSVAVTLTAAGGGYRGRTAGLTVMVVDAEGVQQEVVEQVLADAAWSNLTSSTSTVASRLDSIPGQRTAVLSGRTVDLGSGRGAETVLGLVQSLGADSGAAAERSDPDRGGGDWLGGIALRDGRPSTKAHSAAQHRGAPSLGRFDYALGDGSARVGWSVWGSLDEQDFSGKVELDGNLGGTPQYDGSQSSIWLGVDRRLDERWMWGLAYSQSSAEVGYSAGSGAQQVEMDLSILLLYGRMSLSGGGSLNAALGTGWGEMEAVNGYGRRAAADLSLSVISLNGSWPVSRQGRSTLSLTGGLGQGQLNSAGASGGCTSPDCAQDGFRGVNHALTIGDLGAVHTHISAGVRLTHQGLGGDWSLRPRIEVALRQDMGDGPGGMGMEFSGSAELVTPQERVSLSVDTHSLILHSASEVEQRSGYRLHFRLHPRDAAGRGLSFALGPEWGARPDQGALQREDVFLESRSDPAGSEPSGDRLRTALSATLGYGWGLRSGMWTPYAEYRVPGSVHGATHQTAGLRFLLRDRLQGRAYGERRVHPSGRSDSRLRLELRRLF